MSVIIHFLNGNDESIKNHYFQKEYRNDIFLEIHGNFYEVYFFVADTLEFEMKKDGFFSLPGLIILDEITNEKIFSSINYLIDSGYFENFVPLKKIDINKTFANKWYNNTFQLNIENIYSSILRE